MKLNLLPSLQTVAFPAHGLPLAGNNPASHASIYQEYGPAGDNCPYDDLADSASFGIHLGVVVLQPLSFDNRNPPVFTFTPTPAYSLGGANDSQESSPWSPSRLVESHPCFSPYHSLPVRNRSNTGLRDRFPRRGPRRQHLLHRVRRLTWRKARAFRSKFRMRIP